MLKVATTILRLPPLSQGVIVEAGVFKGGGTAKLSLACAIAGKKLVAFDSFQGLPPHEEASPNVLYPPGVYFGAKQEVIKNLKDYGDISVVDLVEGWQVVAVAYLDVDLVSSTTVCLRYIWPLMLKGSIFFAMMATCLRFLNSFMILSSGCVSLKCQYQRSLKCLVKLALLKLKKSRSIYLPILAGLVTSYHSNEVLNIYDLPSF